MFPLIGQNLRYYIHAHIMRWQHVILFTTRIGVDRVEEFGEILDVFNQFPIKELIIHPRLQKDLYGNKPDWSAFAQAVKMSRAPLCYNGDIFTVADYERFCDEFPAIETIMLGRGILRNPGLVDEIRSAHQSVF